MMPAIHLNGLAIAAAILASMVLGFLWWGPLFGRAWAKEMKMPADFKPAPGVFARALALQALGAFLTAFVLAHSTEVWRGSVWVPGSVDMASPLYGFYAASFTWAGFYVPLLFGGVGWEGKSWKLFWINAGGHLLTLQVVGQILANWR